MRCVHSTGGLGVYDKEDKAGLTIGGVRPFSPAHCSSQLRSISCSDCSPQVTHLRARRIDVRGVYAKQMEYEYISGGQGECREGSIRSIQVYLTALVVFVRRGGLSTS